MKKRIVALLSLLLFAFVLFLILIKHGQRSIGPFKRVFKDVIRGEKIFTPLNVKAQRIAGLTTNGVYIYGNDAGIIYKIPYSLNEISEIKLPVWQDLNKRIGETFQTIVDSPYVYIFANNRKAIFTGKLDNDSLKSHQLNVLFVRAVPLTPESFIIRAYERSVKDQLFFKLNLLSDTQIKERSISTINGDGGLQTDGVLLFDKATQSCLYVSYKQNKILKFDTLLTEGTTYTSIDSSIQEKAAAVHLNRKANQSILTNKGPQSIIHQQATIHEGRLYVLSNLCATNQPIENFKNHFTIDVYSCANLEYIYSFYIPKSGRKFRDFRITDQGIVVLYQDFMDVFPVDGLFAGNVDSFLI